MIKLYKPLLQFGLGSLSFWLYVVLPISLRTVTAYSLLFRACARVLPLPSRGWWVYGVAKGPPNQEPPHLRMMTWVQGPLTRSPLISV